MTDEQRNILNPFRRDRKRDFASGTGPELLRSKVLQALITRGATPRSAGELPWRTAFGSGLDLLRHQRNDAALAELARVYVRDALKRWVPEAELVSVSATRQDATLQIKVRFRVAGKTAKATRPTGEVSVSLDV